MWRKQAASQLQAPGINIIDIMNLLPTPTMQTGSTERIIESLISESDLVLGHAGFNSWQSKHELYLAKKYAVPTHVNVAGPEVGWANDPKFNRWNKHTSMQAAITAVKAKTEFVVGSGRAELVSVEDYGPHIKVVPDSGAGILSTVYEQDCGYDLTVYKDTTIQADSFSDIDCGISLELPANHWGFITGRSSTFRKKGLMVLPGVIDAGYRGRIFTGIFNTNKVVVEIEAGERLAQLILVPMAVFPVVTATDIEDLSESDRGDKGFGSSGK